MEGYFEIYFGEDGLSIRKIPEDELKRSLNDGRTNVSVSSSKALDNGGSVGMESNWDNYKSIILKGEIVIPKAVEKVTKYEID